MRVLLVVSFVVGVSVAGQALAVNKCRDADGRTVYSDLPCRPGMGVEAAPKITDSGSTERVPRVQRPRVDTGPLKPIDFGVSVGERISKAGAVISSILVDARDCDWALKVTRDESKCVRFLQQMIAGREFAQATTALAETAVMDGVSQAQELRLRSLLREIEEIVQVRDFAVVRLNL